MRVTLFGRRIYGTLQRVRNLSGSGRLTCVRASASQEGGSEGMALEVGRCFGSAATRIRREPDWAPIWKRGKDVTDAKAPNNTIREPCPLPMQLHGSRFLSETVGCLHYQPNCLMFQTLIKYRGQLKINQWDAGEHILYLECLLEVVGGAEKNAIVLVVQVAELRLVHIHHERVPTLQTHPVLNTNALPPGSTDSGASG